MTVDTFEHPYYPIIYVRGYAGTQGEVEETVADPYMGFNVGSTKIRQDWKGLIERYFFESPLVRMMKDFEYEDVYASGQDMPSGSPIRTRSIVIYRYYEPASQDLGIGKRDEIETYATGLGNLILSLYDRLKDSVANNPGRFKVYLVAHSMGGLICRCFLQNDSLLLTKELGTLQQARKMVDKVFTYATPHNGIDVKLIGNLPGLISFNNSDTFNRGRMKDYLSLDAAAPDDDVSSLNGKFDPSRFFCLVGTNHRDYAVAGNMAAKIVGPMSDGLVRISNATVWGPKEVAPGQWKDTEAPRAFVHRCHSGQYGIVNSEEGFQNLTRFFFGNLRVDSKLLIQSISLPNEVEEKMAADKKNVKASYHFEVILRVRGKRWDLHRRLVSEESAIFRKFDEIFKPEKDQEARHPALFSAFLSTNQRVNMVRPSLGFSIDLGVLVPEYEVDGLLFLDHHYEGGYLYRDKINLEALPPDPPPAPPVWRLGYGFDSQSPNQTTTVIDPEPADPTRASNGWVFKIPIKQLSKPGIDAILELTATPWNEEE